MKTALIHDWIVNIGGAEKVLNALHEIVPSPIYTLFANKEKARAFIPAEIHTSYLQNIFAVFPHYRYLLPLFPHAIKRWDLSDYDVIISSSHAVAKGVRKQKHQIHICYCHTPMRYAWDLYATYFGKGFKSKLLRPFFSFLRQWDFETAQNVDYFIANSQFVQKRIEKFYQKNAVVIYPPVNTHFFSLCTKKESFYLAASRLVGYKKIDVIIDAFNEMPDKKLIVIGEGPQKTELMRKAKGNIQILGYQSDEVLKQYMQKARGFLFAAVEDFGILPVEAQSCGTAVIAYKKGGALETVVENETGLFFERQNKQSIKDAVAQFEKYSFSPLKCRQQAEKFSQEVFWEQVSRFLKKLELF